MMATDIARAFFVGRLTRDIEILFSGNGNLFGVMNLAVNVYQGKNLPEKTSFFRITVPGRTVDAIGTWLTKGRQVAVDAVPVMSSWTDSAGTRKTRVQFDASNIQLLGSPRSEGIHQETTEQGTESREEHVNDAAPALQDMKEPDDFEDDMPF